MEKILRNICIMTFLIALMTCTFSITSHAARVCVDPGCYQPRVAGKEYCARHICPKCGQYPYLEHTCICAMEGCNEWQHWPNRYCEKHANLCPKCHRSSLKEGEEICYSCTRKMTCIKIGCNEPRSLFGDYCEAHDCPSCTLSKEPDQVRCTYCKMTIFCEYPGCTNGKGIIDHACPEHICVVDGCGHMKHEGRDKCDTHLGFGKKRPSSGGSGNSSGRRYYAGPSDRDEDTEESVSEEKRSDPYDVYDFDDPDDFADEWADEFGDGDWDDGYDEAWDYWMDRN